MTTALLVSGSLCFGLAFFGAIRTNAQPVSGVGATLSLATNTNAVSRVDTNGVALHPRDPAAQIAFNPFLELHTNALGQVVFDYRYQSTNSVSPPTRPVIEIHPDGATGRNGRHTVHFKANLKDEDAIVIVLPDNQILQGRVVALSISDDRGNRVWLGGLKDCQGQVVGEHGNQVLYVDAFLGLRADILFTYDLNYIEQDVLIREWPTLPPEIDEATARLEAWSAFSRAPEPRKLVTQVILREAITQAGGKAIVSADESLDFSSMRMVGGRSFFTSGDEDPAADPRAVAPVVKRWFRDGTVSYLVETTDYLTLKPALEALSRQQAQANPVTAVTNLAFLATVRPVDSQEPAPRENSLKSRPTTLLASRLVKSEPGVVLDYRLVTTALLNINFGTINHTGPAAAGKSTSDYWNLFNTAWNTYGSLDNLAWSDGAASGIQLVLENAPGVWGNSTGDGMMDNYVYPFSHQENATVRLNYIPTGRYDFYVYGAWGGVGVVNGNYVLSVAGQAQGQKQTVLGANWASLNWTEEEHYVLYPNVEVGSGQQVTIVAMPGADVALFNGLQMVAAGSVNYPPTTSNIPDQTTAKNTAKGPISFTVNDAETAAGALTVTALITVTVSDGAAQASDSFLLMVTDASDYVEISKANMVADASTTGWGWLPQYAINGSTADPGWHNEEGRTPGTDWLRVNLGASYPVARVKYHPRQGAGNGTFLEYAIYVTDNSSTEMNSWGDPVATGIWSWPNGAETKTVDFPSKTGRYVIFRCLRGANYDRYASADEVWVYTRLDGGSGPAPLVTEITSFGTLRNNWDGWVGFQFTAGSTAMTVAELGRWVVSGNSANHVVKLFYADGTAVPNGEVTVSTAGKPAGQFAYANLGAPVTLTPASTYLLMSREANGGDRWYDYSNTQIRLTAQATAAAGTWAYPAIPPYYGASGGSGRSYGPVNLRFTTAATDSDNDGLPDNWETQYFGNLAQNGGGDWDADGGSNLQEYQLGTNPTSTDTDSDGLPDGWEVANGLNPNSATDANADPDGDGLTNFEEYKLQTNPKQGNVTSISFSPVGGSYASAQNVTVTCPTIGATIHYTTNGQEPTESDLVIASGSAVLVDHNVTLKAKAWKTGWVPSDTETQSYQIATTPANLAPALTIAPPSGSSFVASDDIEILVEASDRDGTISKVQLYRGDYKIAETTTSPLRYYLNNVVSGSYTFTAKAIDNAGAVTVSPPITISINASGPVVAIVGAQPFFTASPGTLLARVVGANPGALTSLTLNGASLAPTTGEFPLTASLVEGENQFTLVATDNLGRSAQAATKVYLDSVSPTISISAPQNNSSFNTTRVNVQGLSPRHR